MAIILASASPRRLQLLEQIQICAQVVPANIDEAALVNELPIDYVQRLAHEKAKVIASEYTENVVLAADTIVTLGGEIFGKPRDKAHAFSMWGVLSGRQHKVYTAMSVISCGEVFSAISCNEVTFKPLTEAMMQSYWDSGEPCGKAGAYAIQGQAARWITNLNGSYSGVMGLDLYLCDQLLQQAGVVHE